MVYGIILNQNSTENLIELQGMIESGSMWLAIQKCTDEELEQLAEIIEQMREAVKDTDDPVERFFRVDNSFHAAIQEMGKNPLAKKISRVIGTLTYAMRHQTVQTMLETGRSEELIAAHVRLYDILKTKDVSNLDADVLATYFTDALKEGEPEVK